MKKRDLSVNDKIESILLAAAIMLIGILLFKFIPMKIFGADIKFDASLHLVTAIFVLYILWYFIDQNKSLRIPYLIFSLAVLMIISFQRILTNAHNDIGLLLGLVIGLAAIVISRWDYFKDKFSF